MQNDGGICARFRFYPGKRLLDIAFALAAILALWPALLCISAFIWLKDGGPVVYKHTRVGLNGRRFPCLKFRTMIRDGDAVLAQVLSSDPEALEEWAQTQKLRNDPRVIPGIGTFLRKASLDELPQLFNVLRGDMSLVGPRPITEGELKHYGPHLDAYLSLRPGLTGPWQVSGRSDVTYGERVKLDAGYAENNSILKDLWIIATTVPIVATRRGAYVLGLVVLKGAIALPYTAHVVS